LVEGLPLHLEVFEMFELGGQSDLEGPRESAALLGEPLTVAFGPRGSAFAIDQAVVEKRSGDPMLSGCALALVGVPEPKQAAEGFLVFSGNMNGSQVPAAVELDQHDSIEMIGLSMLSRLTRDERRSDHLTGKAVPGEHAVENKPGARGFIAGLDGAFLGQPAKEATDAHQVPRELEDLGLRGVFFENGGRDRIEMHVETDPSILTHGWTPPKNGLSVSITHVALAQVRLTTLKLTHG
jgi:hypothetical protein